MDQCESSGGAEIARTAERREEALSRRPAAARPDGSESPQPSSALTAASVVALQRSLGNRAVCQVLSLAPARRGIQRKLKGEQLAPLLKDYPSWGLSFEWSIADPGFTLPAEMHRRNYHLIRNQLIARELDHGPADIEQVRAEIAKHKGRTLILDVIPFHDQIAPALDPAVLTRVSDLLAKKENAWILGEHPGQTPGDRHGIITKLLQQRLLTVETPQEDNALVAWREGLLEGEDIFSLERIWVPSKSSGAAKSVKDKQCGDFSLMRFLGLDSLEAAATLFGKEASGETENIDILRVLASKEKPLVVPRPTAWDAAEPMLQRSTGPWYVLIFFNEPTSPEAIGHAVVMRSVLNPNAATGKGEILFQSAAKNSYVIYDPQGNLSPKKPLDSGKFILAWGS